VKKQRNTAAKKFLTRMNIPNQENLHTRKGVGAARTVRFFPPEKQNVRIEVVNFTFARKTPAVTVQVRNQGPRSNLPYPHICTLIRLYPRQTLM
jgi:hypothetical protein